MKIVTDAAADLTPEEEVLSIHISPVLGVHTGPGIVGAAVMPLHLVEEFA